jgi:hypothetical protein
MAQGSTIIWGPFREGSNPLGEEAQPIKEKTMTMGINRPVIANLLEIRFFMIFIFKPPFIGYWAAQFQKHPAFASPREAEKIRRRLENRDLEIEKLLSP